MNKNVCITIASDSNSKYTSMKEIRIEYKANIRNVPLLISHVTVT